MAKVGCRDGAKQQQRHGDGENEIGKTVAGLLADKLKARSPIADRDQREDRQDGFDEGRHGR